MSEKLALEAFHTKWRDFSSIVAIPNIACDRSTNLFFLIIPRPY
ncbi:hypothetical protein [Anabaena azotica]